MTYAFYYMVVILIISLISSFIYVVDNDKEDIIPYLLFVAIVLFWPLAVIILPIIFLIMEIHDRREKSCNAIYRKIRWGIYESTTEDMATMSTSDLKFLFKGFRNGTIENLKPYQIEILKRVIEDRIAEEHLLK